MKVQVFHCLSSVLAYIDHGPETPVELLPGGQLGRDGEHMTEQRSVLARRMCERFEMPARDYEEMHRRLWVNIAESDHLLVSVEGFNREFARGDPAKKTFHAIESSAPDFLRHSQADEQAGTKPKRGKRIVEI